MLFSHVTVGSNDLGKSKIFYDAIFKVMDAIGKEDGKDRFLYMKDNQMFMVTKPIDGKPATSGNGGTIGLYLTSIEQVKQWHAAGVEHGGRTVEDPPGIREMGDVKLYLAYLRDPDGNKLCGYHLINE